MDHNIDDLLELERLGWQSLCDGTGSAFYERAMAEDGLMVLAGGMTMRRDEVAAALQSAPPWASFRIDDPRVISVSEQVAILVYLGTGFRTEGDAFVAVMSSTYLKQDAGWRLALYQQTPVSSA
jgi:hypothetical protein